MQYSNSPISCGILSIYDLRKDLEGFLRAYEGGCYGTALPYVLFSSTVRAGSGRWLAKKLKKFGKVKKFGPRKNPNSGRRIELFVWEPSVSYKRKVIKKGNDNYRIW